MGRKMPIAICTNCGQVTNSATSNYWLDTEIDGKTQKEICVATKCYLSFVEGRWVKGCVYNDIGPMKKAMFAHLLLNKGIQDGSQSEEK